MSHAMTFGEEPTSDDRLWGLLAHLSAFVVPFFGSLVIYLIHKDKPYIAYHAAQCLAAQFGVYVAGAIISVIAAVTCGVGSILYLALLPAPLLPLWGAYLAYVGEWKGYPLIGAVGR